MAISSRGFLRPAAQWLVWGLVPVAGLAADPRSRAVSAQDTRAAAPTVRLNSWRDRQTLTRDRRERQAHPPATPRHPERATHRGWEVRTEHFVVFANTSREDAVQAAQQFAATWESTSQLVRQFSRTVPAAGSGMTLVEIDGDPPRRTVNDPVQFHQVGTEFHVYINRHELDRLPRDEAVQASAGTPSDPTSIALRLGAARAYLHAADLQGALPAWFQFGLSGYLAGLTEQDASASLAPHIWPRWQLPRAGSRQLADSPHGIVDSGMGNSLPPAEAIRRVRFLLEANNAELAPELLQAARQTLQQPRSTRVYEFPRHGTPDATGRVTGDTSLDQLFERVAGEYEAWVQATEPQGWIADSSADQVDPQIQHEVVTLLRIAQRVSDQPRSRLAAPSPNSSRFSPPPDFLDRLENQVLEASENEALAWAVLAPDGRLVLSNDTEQLRALFQAVRSTTRLVHEGETLAAQRRLPDGRILVAEWKTQANAEASRERAADATDASKEQRFIELRAEQVSPARPRIVEPEAGNERAAFPRLELRRAGTGSGERR